ncbi:MAG: AAA family ATPase [bacterium]
MKQQKEILGKKERGVQDTFISSLRISKRKTKKPVMVALVGLVGSGKSSVAREFARHIGGTVVEADAIRVALRKQKESYRRVRVIGENAALEVVGRGGNAILDSDFLDMEKRANFIKNAKDVDARLVFVRTYADIDTMLGRMILAQHSGSPNDFFGGASSSWKGSDRPKGAIVKIREMWRRTPLHYAWKNEGGGTWTRRKLSFPVFAEIDTTDERAWKEAVVKHAKQLLKR